MWIAASAPRRDAPLPLGVLWRRCNSIRPLEVLRERAGYTEAKVVLCRAAGLESVGVCCEILSPDGQMAGPAELERFALPWGQPLIEIADLSTFP